MSLLIRPSTLERTRINKSRQKTLSDHGPSVEKDRYYVGDVIRCWLMEQTVIDIH